MDASVHERGTSGLYFPSLPSGGPFQHCTALFRLAPHLPDRISRAHLRIQTKPKRHLRHTDGCFCSREGDLGFVFSVPTQWGSISTLYRPLPPRTTSS